MPAWIEWTLAALVLLGAAFVLIGAWGLATLPDVYMRLHAPTKACTLGVGALLLASLALGWWHGESGWHEVLVTLFVFVTAPVSASLIAQAALHLGATSRAPLPRDAHELCEAQDTPPPPARPPAT